MMKTLQQLNYIPWEKNLFFYCSELFVLTTKNNQTYCFFLFVCFFDAFILNFTTD